MVAALVLAGLVIAAGVSGRFGVVGPVALAAISVVWLLVNGPVEGPVLIAFSAMHGITGADLAGLTGLALAGVQALLLARRSSSRPDRGVNEWDVTG